ncbi:hypothetical protein [Parasitella parasitica]|uniref:Uncharacterized protein n=1 Tax=Parasitella parasitica TaxID=35722 RepID=A0A0B7NAJ2_9FUNG|nr:hypothetical protein [Parasitella parasitica]
MAPLSQDRIRRFLGQLHPRSRVVSATTTTATSTTSSATAQKPTPATATANRTTRQLPYYVSWMLDPDALYTDALSIPWTNLATPFANPPWNLISRILNKIQQEQVPLVTLVVPYWPSALWLPLLRRLALSSPWLLPPSSGANHIPSDPTSFTRTELDALRVAALRSQLLKQHLNAQAVEDIMAEKLAPTGQLRFLDWAMKNGRLFYLLHTCRTRELPSGFAQPSCSTSVYVKNRTSSSILSTYTMTKQAPPVSIHKPTIDISPALLFARSIASRPTTSIKLLQQKLAFLLAVAAFLRPSDLARILYDSVTKPRSMN